MAALQHPGALIKTLSKCVHNMVDVHTSKQAQHMFSVLLRRQYSTAGTPLTYEERNTVEIETAKPFSEIPGPKGLPIIGTLLQALIHEGTSYEVILKKFEEYGPIYKEKMGALSLLYLKDLEAVEKIHRLEGKLPRRISINAWKEWRAKNELPGGILIEDGPEWKRMRTVLDKRMLRPKQVRTYAGDFNQVITDFITRLTKLRDSVGGGVTVPNLDKELFYWSLETIGTVLYETRFGGLSDHQDPDMGAFIEAVNNMFETTEKVVYMPESLRKIFMPKAHRVHENAWDTIFRVGKQIIDAKMTEMEESLRNNPDAGNEEEGFLSFLLASGSMSRGEIYANISELMLGAVDTTSNTMQWAIYKLSRHPEIQERLHQEVMSVTGGAIPNQEHIDQMPYMKGVLKEILRLYPVAGVVTRVLNSDLCLCGYFVPEGTTVIGSTYAMGRDPEVFTDPLEVKPERWLRNQDNKNVHNFAWLPFGFGPRMCIGRRVAELEMHLLTARLSQKFIIEPMTDEILKEGSRGLLIPEKAPSVKFIDRQ